MLHKILTNPPCQAFINTAEFIYFIERPHHLVWEIVDNSVDLRRKACGHL